MSSGWLNPSERNQIVFNSRLESCEKLVLLAISFHMMRGPECWPSQARLAELTSLSPRSIKYAVSRLKKWDVLRVQSKRGGPGGGTGTNHYDIHWEALASGMVGEQAYNAPGAPRGRARGALPQNVPEPESGEARGAPPQDVDEPEPASTSCGGARGAPGREKESLGTELLTDKDCLERKSAALRELLSDRTRAHASAHTPDHSQTSDVDDDQEDKGRHNIPEEAGGGSMSLHQKIAELESLGDPVGDPEPEAQEPQPLPVDPELEAARLQDRLDKEKARQADRREREAAAQMDHSLQILRNPKSPSHRRVALAAPWFKLVAILAGLEKSRVRFNPTSDHALQCLEELIPEASTWDVVAALRETRLDDRCWKVILTDGVWPGVVALVEHEAGNRLRRELGIVAHREVYSIEAVRKYQAGLIDREGNRINELRDT